MRRQGCPPALVAARLGIRTGCCLRAASLPACRLSACLLPLCTCLLTHPRPAPSLPCRCQDENRHGDFLTAMLKARPELLKGLEAR